jgi:predicted acetyltransferase
MPLEIRPHTEKEYPAFRIAHAWGFLNHPRTEPAELAIFKKRYERDRSLAVFDGGQIVGTAGICSFEMTVPGGAAIPVAGVSYVTVAATHRRQGVLRQMMGRQLKDVRDRGEPAAILWASESVIYGRFGYGLSIQHEKLSIDRLYGEFAHGPTAPGRVRWVAEKEARKIFPKVWDQARPLRPGMIARTPPWWDNLFHDPEWRRWGGGGAYFFAVYEEEGRPDGYVMYRIKREMVDMTEANVLMVAELVTATDAAYAALWRFCLNIDLTGAVEAWNRPLEEPLSWMLADPRRLRRSPYDALWLRLVDVPAALSKRTYAQQGKLVIEVRDDFCPWAAGRFKLEGGPEGAECKAATSKPDIVLGTAELSAIYMGGHRLTPIARAGRAEERTPGALTRADAMFAADVAPWCPQGF